MTSCEEKILIAVTEGLITEGLITEGGRDGVGCRGRWKLETENGYVAGRLGPK